MIYAALVWLQIHYVWGDGTIFHLPLTHSDCREKINPFALVHLKLNCVKASNLIKILVKASFSDVVGINKTCNALKEHFADLASLHHKTARLTMSFKT